MKNKIIFSVCFLISSLCDAQLALLPTPSEFGDKQYDQFAFIDALDFYLKAYQKGDSASTELKWKIAECYRRLNNPVKAELWYEKVICDLDAPPIAKYYYAESLKSNKKYDQAKIWLEEYQSEVEDRRVRKKIDAIDKQHEMLEDKGYFEITKVNFNLESADFSPVFYEDGVVFVSSRNRRPLGQKYSWDNTNFLDLFYSKIENDTLGSVSPFNARINSKLHDGPIDFYQNETKAVFTRNNFAKKRGERNDEGVSHLQLYFVEKTENGWGKINPFEYNDEDYSTGHATISEDGSLMIFVSDSPEGYGEGDLFFSENIGGIWGVPENLGHLINTAGNELFPTLVDSTLYFASDGHGGLGGLDIFKVHLSDLASLENLGAPINSSLDDFGLVLSGNEGYFSSNRDGDDDIFHLVDNRLPYFVFTVKVVNELDGAPIPGAKVIINDHLEFITNDDGMINSTLPVNDKYHFEAEKSFFELINSETRNIKREMNEVLTLKMKPAGLYAKIIVVDKETREMLPEPLIKLKDLTTDEDIEPILIEKDATLFQVMSGHEYELMGAKREYFTGHINEHTIKKTGAVDWEIPLSKIELNKEIRLENIYYDLDKATLRPDATKELDKLVKILKDNPTIKIELSSHTDARGGDDYNLSLSQRRAESAVRYILENDIDPGRIIAKGYGEQKLVNGCANGVKCAKDQHQENRRTEFKVLEY